jgi:long-chain acyl-CoA synthetase
MTITTTGGLIRTHGTERADVPALLWADEQLTYGELHHRSSQVAQALAAEGVGPQDRVCILDKNAEEYFELQYGAAKLNAVLTPVNWRLAPPEVAYIVNDAGAKVFAVGTEFLPVLDAVRDQLTTVTKVVVIGEATDADEAFSTWRDRFPAVDPEAPQAADDVAYQLYSSGTTGLPKGVQLTNRNLFSAMPMYEALMETSAPGAVNLVAMPLFHIGGGGWAMAGMYCGMPGVLVRDVDPTRIAELIETHRITHGFLVPAVLQFMLMIPEARGWDFSSLRYMLYGASPISTQVLADSVRTFGCKFMQAYGLTETTGTVVLLPPEDHDPDGPNAHRLRAAGKAIPGCDLKIVDPSSGEEVAVGDVGEIWVRTAQNMKGYWNLPEETATSILPDGFFRTGDAGYLDADGYVYIHDRVKDMIVSGGENIYPAEVENVLMSHPAVADCAVIGVPSDRWGETPKALVVRAADTDPTADELVAYCRERLAHYKCPTSVDWVTAIPRNPSGKVLKKDLRKPYWEGRDRFVG